MRGVNQRLVYETSGSLGRFQKVSFTGFSFVFCFFLNFFQMREHISNSQTFLNLRTIFFQTREYFNNSRTLFLNSWTFFTDNFQISFTEQFSISWTYIKFVKIFFQICEHYFGLLQPRFSVSVRHLLVVGPSPTSYSLNITATTDSREVANWQNITLLLRVDLQKNITLSPVLLLDFTSRFLSVLA